MHPRICVGRQRWDLIRVKLKKEATVAIALTPDSRRDPQRQDHPHSKSPNIRGLRGPQSSGGNSGFQKIAIKASKNR